MGVWPNFRSPLMFDVMAITTYLTASSIFIYMGSVPDFAAVRDSSTGLRKRLYTIFSFGWRGTDKEWHTLGWAYTFFAVFVIPLAVSVHSIVSWDFALSVVPGFHHTIFAPYFVCGAIYSGTAGIVTVMYLLRKYLQLERYILPDHFDKLGKLLVVLSLIWSYINVMELFSGWYSGGSFEIESLRFKLFGFYAPMFWEMIFCCTFVPMLMLSKKRAHELELDAGDLAVHQPGDAQRAFHHRGHCAAAQVPAGRFRLLFPELVGVLDHSRFLRSIRDLLPRLHQVGALRFAV